MKISTRKEKCSQTYKWCKFSENCIWNRLDLNTTLLSGQIGSVKEKKIVKRIIKIKSFPRFYAYDLHSGQIFFPP